MKLIAWYEPTYENPRGFSIPFVFAKLVAETRNEIIHKHVSCNNAAHFQNRNFKQ